MAYAVLRLETETKNKSNVDVPLGFSWPILLTPALVGTVFFIGKLVVFSIFGIFENPGLGASLSSGNTLLVVFSFVFITLQLISPSLIPLFRNDKKWAVIMAISGIVSLGMSTIFFAFIYNKRYIYERYREGYRVTEIMTMESDSKKLQDINPVAYSQLYGHYYIWVGWFGIKFMRYFPDIEGAFSFILANSKNCIAVKHIVTTVRSLSKIDNNLHMEFMLPIDLWKHTLT